MKYEISKFSPAKLNLYLEIIDKDVDGYHNLESMMCFCDYGDSIAVSKSDDLTLKIDGPFSNFLEIIEYKYITRRSDKTFKINITYTATLIVYVIYIIDDSRQIYMIYIICIIYIIDIIYT